MVPVRADALLTTPPWMKVEPVKAPDKGQVTTAEYEIRQILVSKILKPVLMYK